MTSLDDRPTTALPDSRTPAGRGAAGAGDGLGAGVLPLAGCRSKCSLSCCSPPCSPAHTGARHVLLAPAYVIRNSLLMALSVLVAATFPLLEDTTAQLRGVSGVSPRR
jgi:hypothetical protein